MKLDFYEQGPKRADGISFQVFRAESGALLRETEEPEPGALSETLMPFVRIRVVFPGSFASDPARVVDMKVPVPDTLRDPELETLLARPDNIEGFINQARLHLPTETVH